MKEIWEDVKGYEDLYQVSNIGRVRSKDRMRHVGHGHYGLKKGRILKPYKMKSREYGYYLQVTLCRNNKHTKHLIHRLVAQAFIENHDNKPCVNHIDGDKANNRVDNLEWCTFSDNNQHAYDTKLKKPYYQKMDYELASKMLHEGRTKEEIADYFGVRPNSVYMSIRRKRIG